MPILNFSSDVHTSTESMYSEIVMVDLALWDDIFKQDRSCDDLGTIISGIWGTHQSSIGSRMPVSFVVPRAKSKLGSFYETNYEKTMSNNKNAFFLKSDVSGKKLPAGLHHTEVRIGDAPKTHSFK